MNDCIFCKIVNGELPSAKVYEDEKHLAFMDIMPATKGHVLIIPKWHYKEFLEIPVEEAKGLIAIVHNVADAVIKATNSQGYKLENFNGAYSGQSIFHVHFHIIPRFEGDELEYDANKRWWVPKKYKEDEINKYAS